MAVIVAMGLSALIVGAVLLFISLTAAHAPRLPRPFREPFGGNQLRGPLLVARTSDMSIATLRSQYEQHIRQAAQLEERARLARDLHDAVKQQLFAIQTAAATAQERFSTDEAGGRSALDHVRAAARDAMTEMQAMIEQLQAAPSRTTGSSPRYSSNARRWGCGLASRYRLTRRRCPPATVCRLEPRWRCSGQCRRRWPISHDTPGHSTWRCI